MLTFYRFLSDGHALNLPLLALSVILGHRLVLPLGQQLRDANEIICAPCWDKQTHQEFMLLLLQLKPQLAYLIVYLSIIEDESLICVVPGGLSAKSSSCVSLTHKSPTAALYSSSLPVICRKESKLTICG